MTFATFDRKLARPALWFWFSAAIWVLVDQAVKWIQMQSMSVGDSIALWPGVFHLTYVENVGAAFSIFGGARLLFLVAAVVFWMGTVLFWRVEKPHTLFSVVGPALMCAGALGNAIDRLRFGHVIDIFDARIINFAVFNVADAGITIGVIAAILWALFGYEQHDSSSDTSEAIR